METKTAVYDLISDAFGEAFATLDKCVKLFVDAKLEERIYFDHAVFAAGLETVSQLTAHAAKLAPEPRVKYLQHWAKHGPQLCQEIITSIERRNPPVVHPEDFDRFLMTMKDYH